LLCEITFNFVCNNVSHAADQSRKNCGVVPAARANMYDRLTDGWCASSKTAGVQGRLPVVYAPFSGETDKNVLIEQSWVIGQGRYVT